jgi:hypothetical protein
MTTQNTRTDPQVSQHALDAVRIAKEKHDKAVLLNKAKVEESRLKRREAGRKFAQRIKNGVEKTVSWYEHEFTNICYDGMVYGGASALIGATIGMLMSNPAIISMAVTFGGITAIIPIVVALAYWAVKGLVELGKATVRAIKKVHKDAPVIKEAMKEGSKVPANQDPPPPMAGAEATA